MRAWLFGVAVLVALPAIGEDGQHVVPDSSDSRSVVWALCVLGAALAAAGAWLLRRALRESKAMAAFGAGIVILLALVCLAAAALLEIDAFHPEVLEGLRPQTRRH